MAAFSTLLGTSLRSWLGAKGFWLVVGAALFPLALTGAWVATHQADVAAQSVAWEPVPLVENQEANFTGVVANTGRAGVGPFNASLSVGRVFGNVLRPEATNTTRVEHLDPGESTELRVTWTPRPGVYFALVDADSTDEVGEVDEFNNQRPMPLVVHYATPNRTEAPSAPGNLTGDANATERTDLAVLSVDWEPRSLRPGERVTLIATVANRGPDALANGSATLRLGRVFSGQLFPTRETTEQLALGPGEERTVSLAWDAQEGAFWVQAFVNASGALDPNGANNHLAGPVVVQPFLGPETRPPEPPEKLTIKEFYLQILSLVHLTILLPLVGLWYAAGVLADDREAGNLPYLLTRPLPRWVIPLSRFLASYAVAALAVVAGLVLTFLLLFGALGQDVGFLTTPLLASLLALFAYGAFFTLLGVLVDRPYLIGLAFVIGWETVARAFVPWVQNLTIKTHVVNALNAWSLDQGFQWLPQGEDGLRALQLVIVAGAVFLGLAAYAVRRREFNV